MTCTVALRLAGASRGRANQLLVRTLVEEHTLHAHVLQLVPVWAKLSSVLCPNIDRYTKRAVAICRKR
jgi:hypothetical protein